MDEVGCQLSVVVCTYNRSALLKACLSSLVNQTTDKSKYEIIIVDNNSTDETQEIMRHFCKSFSNIKLVSEYQQGLSSARNKGWIHASGKYIAFIDDDAIASSVWCEKILSSFLTVTPKPVSVGGPIYPYYETKPPKWFCDDFEIRSWGASPGFLVPPRAFNGFSGSNMAFEKRVLQEVGGFNPKFGMKGDEMFFGEETELFRRIHANEPYFWYDPEIKVYHFTPQRNTRLSYRMIRSIRMGQSSARLQHRRRFSPESFKAICRLMIITLCLPSVLFCSNQEKKMSFARRIEQIGSILGYLLG